MLSGIEYNLCDGVITLGSLLIAATSQGAGKTAFSTGLATWFKSCQIESHVDPVKTVPQNSKSQSTVNIFEGTCDVQSNLKKAEKQDAMVVLVARHSDNLKIADEYGERLAGVVINRVPRYQKHTVEQKRAELGSKFLGSIAEERLLLAPTLDAVVKQVRGEYTYGANQGDQLILNFLLGGMILDWGPFYFGSREAVAVIVRGDRPDLQLSALQTETVRAVLLTMGVEPIEYVQYEAKTKHIPLVKVEASTQTTASKLSELDPEPDFNHPDKLERMCELINEQIDTRTLKKLALEFATR